MRASFPQKILCYTNNLPAIRLDWYTVGRSVQGATFVMEIFYLEGRETPVQVSIHVTIF